MKKLFPLFIVGLLSTPIANAETSPHFTSKDIHNIISQALESESYGFLPHERKALKIFKKALAKAAHKVKDGLKKAAHKTAKVTKKAAKATYKKIKSIPYKRIARDLTSVALPMAKGCVSGIVAGAPLEIGLALETFGVGSAGVAAVSCLVGAVIAGSPQLLKVAYAGIRDIRKSRKLKKEIKANEEDLRQLQLLLANAENVDTTDFDHDARASHLDNILNINRQITAVELYIQELTKARKALKA